VVAMPVLVRGRRLRQCHDGKPEQAHSHELTPPL
jgi:hypothetical protein